MRPLPFTHPGLPDTRSSGRFLLWIARGQWSTLIGGIAFGVAWMLMQALLPFAIGRGVDHGLQSADLASTGRWALIVLALGLGQALAGTMRHRLAVSNWLQAAFRVIQLVSRRSALAGPAVQQRTTTGEVVSTVASDSMHIGGLFGIMAPLIGSIVAYVVVAAILLTTSVPLGLLVLVGVPLLVLALRPIVRPLQRRHHEQRAALGQLTALGSDTVAGLRVLRGIGGEQVFLSRYRERSEAVRINGVRVGSTQALLDAAQVLLPGLFLVVLTWLGARLAVAGTISSGDLVAFYGYAFFLVLPLRNATEAVARGTRAVVACRRVMTILDIRPDVVDPVQPASEPPPGGSLVDTRSGLVARSGTLTAIVSSRPAETHAIASRLGRIVDDPGVSLGGVRLLDLPVSVVRRRICVSGTEPWLFTGTLRDELAPAAGADDDALLSAIHTASAGDVLEALPAGLGSAVEERGRSFSGGQRQRLVLARALVRDPEVLVLVEPTSAVDAHTEARIAERLRTHRHGRTTVVITTSPLLLNVADSVAWIEDGRVVAEGSHRDLLEEVAGYRNNVVRGEES